MRNPLLDEIRRIRAKRARERAQDPNRDYLAEAYELRLKVCDLVIDEEGKDRYITNGKKMYEALIAPRLAKGTARAKSRARRRPSSGRSPQSKSAAHERR